MTARERDPHDASGPTGFFYEGVRAAAYFFADRRPEVAKELRVLIACRAWGDKDAHNDPPPSGDVERVVRALASALRDARDEIARLAVLADGRVGNDLTAELHRLNAILNTTQARAALRVAPAASGHYCTASKSACEPCHDAPAAPEPGR